MEEVFYYNELFDLYGELLTDNQKSYFKDYYFDNLSYSEMALKYGVSRNASFKQLHNVIEKLKEYEEKLKLYEKRNMILSLCSKIKDEDLREKFETIL